MKPARRPVPLYARVRNILEPARSTAARSVNTAQVVANWLIGREIVEEEQKGKGRADYAERLIEKLAELLTAGYGSGYSVSNLWHMRRFHQAYPWLLDNSAPESATHDSPAILDAVRRESEERLPVRLRSHENKEADEIPDAVHREFRMWRPGRLHPDLSWTHYRTLLRVDRAEARAFYEIEAIRGAWSARELERQIASLLFDRLARSRDKKGLLRLASAGLKPAAPAEIFKDPTVIEFLGLPESPRLTESALEQKLIDNLQQFLLELGAGFAFVGRQHRITLDGDHFYVDLVFCHTILKCYVLIDLKLGKLVHSDLGQIRFYANYFDEVRRTAGDNPTLGLILCSDKNDAVVRYTLGKGQRTIFTSTYRLHLPSEEDLREEIRREARQLAGAETPEATGRKRGKSAAGRKQRRAGGKR